MDSSAQPSDGRRTEFRLLKPMPSRQESAANEPTVVRQQPWDTQVRRLFPPRDTPPAGLPPVAGIQLGHFEIEERIARGGMGTVFRAHDLRLDRIVALKVLSQEQLRDPAAVQRFQNEARSAARLDHENIARVYFIGEDRGVHFIAFEYVRGTTVREAIAAKGQLSQDEAVNYTLQAAEALRHTDAAGVVHRDIKPSNLIVTPSGRVKLVDLGLARQLAPAHEDDLTVTGTTLGTFDYISPEQARDPRNVDVRSDIYSLGCTLFQMLTGSPPYPNGSSVDKLLQHSAGRPPDPVELNPRISPRLSLVVQRMMASNPDERYSSPQALIDELGELARGLGLRATAPEGTIWRKPLYRSGSPWWEENRGWMIAFAAILLLAIVGNDVYQWMLALGSRTNQQGTLSTAVEDERSEPAPSAVNPLEEQAIPATGGPASPSVETRSRPGSLTAGENSAPPPASGANAPGTATSSFLASSTSAAAASDSAAAGDAPSGIDLTEIVKNTARLAAAATVPLASSTPPGGSSISGNGSSGAPAIASTPIETIPAASAAPPVQESPFVVLDAEGVEAGRFQTLEAACHVAESGAVIEIHHHGPLRRVQKPLLIQGKRLTIRPAAGCRPQISFAPTDAALDAVDRRMIDVVDGSLELYDVDIGMQVVNNVYAEQWVLLSVSRARQVVLQRVSMTAVNAGWRPAVLIERRRPTDAPPNMMPNSEPMRDAELQIRDCLFRGNAVFFADRTLEPAILRVTDSAIGVDDDVLLIEGADRADMEATSRTPPVVRVELDHVTAVSGQSFLRLWTEALREPPEVRIECRNSILDVIGSEAPLVLLEGRQDSDVLLERVHWHGARNVLAIDSERGCIARGLWPQTGDEWPFSIWEWQAQWQVEWEISSEAVTDRDLLAWDRFAGSPRSAMQLSDFALRPMTIGESSNPALGTASDSSDRGFRPSLSPLPPVIPQLTTP